MLKWRVCSLLCLTLILCRAGADEVPFAFNYQGRLFNSSGTAPLNSIVDIKYQILNPAGTCLLYEEIHTGINLATTNGTFSHAIGSPIGSAKRTGSDPGLSMGAIFVNSGTVTRVSDTATTNTCSPGYTPANGDSRVLRVTVIDGGVTTVLSPDQAIGSQPYAIVAQSLQGLGPNGFIRVDGSVSITQANIQKLVDGSDVGALHNHDSVYVKKNDTANQNLGSGYLYTTGRIGVGTASPATDIEIERTNPTFRLEAANGGGGSSQIQFYSGATERARIESPENSSVLRFYTGGVAALTIDGNQNASFTGSVRTNGFFDLGDYDNAGEGTLNTYLTGCATNCKGTMWFNTDLNQIRFWNGSVIASVGEGSGQYLKVDGTSTMVGPLDMGNQNIVSVAGIGASAVTATNGGFGSVTSTSAVLGNITLSGGLVRNLSAPVAATDAANKSYVDAAIGSISTSVGGAFVKLDGSTTLTGNWDVGGYILSNTFLRATAGDAINPSLSFDADPDTGFFSSGANTIALSVGGVRKMTIDDRGYIGLGTSTPSVGMHMVAPSSGSADIMLDSYGSWSSSSNVTFRSATGTVDSPTNVLQNRTLGTIGFRGYGASGFSNSSRAYIKGFAAEHWSDTAQGAYLSFGVSSIGTTTNYEAIRLQASGRVGIGTTSPDARLHVIEGAILGPVTITSGGLVRNVATPTVNTDAANKAYVDNAVGSISTASNGAFIKVDGSSTLTGNWNVGGWNIDNVNQLGIGTNAPGVKLDVVGSIRLGNGNETCSGGNYIGVIRYNGVLQYCNGTDWQTLGVAGSGLNNFNGETGSNQALAIGTAGTIPNWVSNSDIHTLNIPLASSANVEAGLLSKADYDSFAAKADGVDYLRRDGTSTMAGPLNMGGENIVGAGAIGATSVTATSGTVGAVTMSSGIVSSGSALIGGVTIAGGLVQNLSAPVAGSDAANKSYVDSVVGAISTAIGSYLALDGTSTMTGQLLSLSGTVGAPGISFGSDSASGLYLSGTSTIAFASGGVEKARVTSDGFFATNVASNDRIFVTSHVSTGTEKWIKIASLPVSGGSNGTHLILTAYGGMPASSDKYRMTIRIGNRSSFSAQISSAEGSLSALAHASVQVYDTGSGHDVYLYYKGTNNTSLGAEVTRSGWGSVTATLYPYEPAISTTPGGSLVFDSQTASIQQYLSNTGNLGLGLGTLTPGVKLHVAGEAIISDVTISSGRQIRNLASPSVGSDAATKSYVDGIAATLVSGAGAGDFKKDGSVTMTAGIPAFAGTPSTPGYAFGEDLDTGIWTPGANTIAISTGGSERLRIDSSGNIGIGNADPKFPLQIKFTNAGIATGFSIINAETPAYGVGSRFGFHGADGTTRMSSIDSTWEDTGANANLVFQTRSANSAAERMRLSANGNLAIGTTITSGAKLTVAGSAIISGITITSGRVIQNLESPTAGSDAANKSYVDGIAATLVSGAGAGDFKKDGSVTMTGTLKATAGTPSLPGYTFDGDPDTGIFLGTADAMGFATGGTNRMSVSNNVIEFHTKLEVQRPVVMNGGGHPLDNMFFAGSQSSGAVDASIGMMAAGYNSGGHTQGPYMVLRGNDYSYFNDQRGSIYIVAGDVSSPDPGEGSIIFKTGVTADDRLIITHGGNIGIGTITPGAKFHVNGEAILGGVTVTASRSIQNVATPVSNSDAATKAYVDSLFSSISVSGGGGSGGSGGSGTAWVKIFSTEVSTATTSVNIPDLDGDNDINYRVVMRAVQNGAATGVDYGLRFNGDSTANYGTAVHWGDGGDNSSNAVFIPITWTFNNGRVSMAEAMVHAKTGQVRTVLSFGVAGINGETIDSVLGYGGSWNNTSSNITSMSIVADTANAIGAGSYIEVWAQRPVGGGSSGAPPIFLAVDEKAATENGGTCTAGSWLTRDLNTVLTNAISGASLSTNLITLPAGTYDVEASAPANQVDKHQARLYNVTGAAVLVLGTSEEAAAGDEVQTRSVMQGRFTLSATSQIRIEHRCEVTRNNDGFGNDVPWGNSVLTRIRLVKVE